MNVELILVNLMILIICMKFAEFPLRTGENQAILICTEKQNRPREFTQVG